MLIYTFISEIILFTKHKIYKHKNINFIKYKLVGQKHFIHRTTFHGKFKQNLNAFK